MRRTTKIRQFFFLLFIGVVSIAAPDSARGQTGPNWFYNVDEGNVALDGYDVVSYFTEAGARMGKPTFVASHDYIEYWFVDDSNRTRFLEDPERYLPACGGWDALLCGADVDITGFAASRWQPTPHAYEVVDGRLFILSERVFLNTLRNFRGRADSTDVIERADAFWAERISRANRMGRRPDGMHAMARMEMADWAPLMGTWHCEGFWLTNPEAGSYTRFASAQWRFFYGYDGMLVQDHWRPYVNPASSGPALRGYDASRNEWKMVFFFAYGPSASSWNMTGRWEDGELRGEYQTEAGVHGTIKFFDIEESSFEWTSNRSTDGGVTWVNDQQKTSCIRS